MRTLLVVEKQMLRSPLPLALSALVLLALAACAQQEAAAPPPPSPAAPLSSDQNFVDRAALGTASEVELGRLARTRALSPAVRTFAALILTDHRQANARLRTLQRRLQMVAAPATPPANPLATFVWGGFRPEVHRRSGPESPGGDSIVRGGSADRARPQAAKVCHR